MLGRQLSAKSCRWAALVPCAALLCASTVLGQVEGDGTTTLLRSADRDVRARALHKIRKAWAAGTAAESLAAPDEPAGAAAQQPAGSAATQALVGPEARLPVVVSDKSSGWARIWLSVVPLLADDELGEAPDLSQKQAELLLAREAGLPVTVRDTISQQARQALLDGGEPAREALRASLSRAEPRLRRQVAEIVGELKDRTSLPLLARMLDDPVVDVRQAARQAVDRMGGLPAPPAPIPRATPSPARSSAQTVRRSSPRSHARAYTELTLGVLAPVGESYELLVNSVAVHYQAGGAVSWSAGYRPIQLLAAEVGARFAYLTPTSELPITATDLDLELTEAPYLGARLFVPGTGRLEPNVSVAYSPNFMRRRQYTTPVNIRIGSGPTLQDVKQYVRSGTALSGAVGLRWRLGSRVYASAEVRYRSIKSKKYSYRDESGGILYEATYTNLKTSDSGIETSFGIGIGF
jgi:hypothetical protein